MAVKIDFGAKPEMEQAEASHNDQEKAKMQEAITMIESGEAERAIEILKELIGGEDAETKMEESEPKPAKEMSFRDQIAKSI